MLTAGLFRNDADERAVAENREPVKLEKMWLPGEVRCLRLGKFTYEGTSDWEGLTEPEKHFCVRDLSFTEPPRSDKWSFHEGRKFARVSLEPVDFCEDRGAYWVKYKNPTEIPASPGIGNEASRLALFAEVNGEPKLSDVVSLHKICFDSRRPSITLGKNETVWLKYRKDRELEGPLVGGLFCSWAYFDPRDHSGLSVAHLPDDMRAISADEAEFMLKHYGHYKPDLTHYDDVEPDLIERVRQVAHECGVELTDLMSRDASRVVGRHRECKTAAYFRFDGSEIRPLSDLALPDNCAACQEKVEERRARQQWLASIKAQPKRRRRFFR